MNPSPQQWGTGVGAFSADWANGLVQSVLNFAQLRTFTGLTDMVVFVLGTVAEGDGGQGNFYYNSTVTATDNNASVIVPNGAIVGAWLRLPVAVASSTPVRPVTTGVTDSLSATDSTVVWYSAATAPKTEVLPAPTTNGQTFTVKDGQNNAAFYPINFTTVSGSIIGANVINVNGNSLTFRADGVSNWLVI